MNNPLSLKKAINQSTLTLILNVTSAVLIILSIVAVFFIIDTNWMVESATQARYELSQNARRFMDGSAYLTNEVRAYASTGNITNYNNYWNEVNIIKNRDLAVERMREIGITAEEESLVAQMFSLSNNLIPHEEQAMDLAKSGNLKAAMDAVYGNVYEDWITRIRAAQSNFIETLAQRTAKELDQVRQTVHLWVLFTMICLSAAAVIQSMSFIMVRAKLIHPLVKVRDEMSRIANGNLHSAFEAMPDTSEMGTLIHSIQKTKTELNSYIDDISEKLAAIASGDDNARIVSEYPGDFDEIKTSINTISSILAAQRDRTKRHREELEKAYQDANAANKAKSSFLSNMSHEIRTPMNAILGMTNIALASDDPERQTHCLNKINDASNHLLGVINDILDMSKIDANKFELSNTEFNFEKMMIRVVNIIRFRVDEKNQHLQIKIDPNVPVSIVSDEQRLAQVITNLLSNAVKFTPENGEISVNVQLKQETPDQCCILLVSVKDNGIGISAEQQKKLFSSFAQADASISRQFGGTGLGLAISKSIIEKMHGRIWVESTERQGATFSFEFCADRGTETESMQPLLEGVRWEDLRILVVDDDKAICEYFLNLASRHAFTCDAVTSGKEACAMLESNPRYDIFFIDWKMPEMNGIELAQQIQDKGGDNSVIIMISSTEWSEIEGGARQAGVNKFVPKPLFASTIMDTIGECLGAEMHLPNDLKNKDLPDFGSYHILLAEDIDINREIVMTLLEPTGIAITCAETGQIALDTFKEKPDLFDMIFMDMHMPEMDGITATTKIRALDHPAAKTIPIVAMTANVFREDIERCLAIGMNDHIGKPIDFDEVIEKTEKYLPPQSRPETT